MARRIPLTAGGTHRTPVTATPRMAAATTDPATLRTAVTTTTTATLPTAATVTTTATHLHMPATRPVVSCAAWCDARPIAEPNEGPRRSGRARSRAGFRRPLRHTRAQRLSDQRQACRREEPHQSGVRLGDRRGEVVQGRVVPPWGASPFCDGDHCAHSGKGC